MSGGWYNNTVPCKSCTIDAAVSALTLHVASNPTLLYMMMDLWSLKVPCCNIGNKLIFEAVKRLLRICEDCPLTGWLLDTGGESSTQSCKFGNRRVILWLSVALNAVREGGNQIDAMTVTHTSMYRRVSALYFWESVPRRKPLRQAWRYHV